MDTSHLFQFFSIAHCFRIERRNLTNLGNIEMKLGNAAKPQLLQLESPKFYVPIHEDNLFNDIQIIQLERTLDDIDPVSLPLNVNDFYFIENEELVTVTLRNEHKERLPDPNHRHEKCTKIHIKTGKWCLMQFVDTAPNPEEMEEDILFLENLPSMEEPSQLPMLCTTEYEGIGGESGGPLVQKLPSGKWAVVGIYSGSISDASKDFLFSDFVSTASHLHWITSIIFQ